jgi:hypothetical protein
MRNNDGYSYLEGVVYDAFKYNPYNYVVSTPEGDALFGISAFHSYFVSLKEYRKMKLERIFNKSR